MLSTLIFISLTVAFVSTQDIEWESTCVTDPFGQPRIHLENHSDGPIVFGAECSNGYFNVYIESHTTRSFLVEFPWATESIGDCVLYTDLIYRNTFFLLIYAYELEGNFNIDAYNYTFCTIDPGVEDRTQVYSDCEVNREGLVDYHFVNNRDEEVIAGFVCFYVVWTNSVQDFFPAAFHFPIQPRSRGVVSLLHYTPNEIGLAHEGDCVLAPTLFEQLYFLLNAVFDLDNSYMVTQMTYCRGRLSEDEPIAEVLLHCPDTTAGRPEIELRADIPAYVVIHCRNGDAHLSAITRASAELVGTFYQGLDAESCQFYKQEDALIYSLTIEIGWGLQDRELFLDSKIQTLSCIYDDHGSSRSSVERVGRPLLTPESINHFEGEPLHHSMFDIKVLDALDRRITTGTMASGRLVRLRVRDTTETLIGFRAYSCTAHNGVTSYTFLINGCGDGLVLGKNQGFVTEGGLVYSPYFKVFKLRGGRNLWFDCLFTDCDGPCDGSSCDWVGEFDDFHRFGDGDDRIFVSG